MNTFLQLRNIKNLLLLVLFTCSWKASLSGDDIIGKWQTTLENKGVNLILILDIQSTSSDSLVCTIHLPEFGFDNLPYGKFLFENNEIALPGFDGAYDHKNNNISGKLSVLGPEMDISLSKIQEKPSMQINCPEKRADWVFSSGGAIWGKPLVYANHIIIGNERGTLYAIKIKDKSVSWKYDTYAPIRSNPLVAGGDIFITSDNGYLYSIDFRSGESSWKVYIGNDVSRRPKLAKDNYAYDYMASSPFYFEGNVYIGSMDSSIYAIDAEQGTIMWEIKTGGIVRSTPIADETNLFVGSWDNHIYSIKAETGLINWKFDAGGAIQSTPAIFEDKVIFGSRSGNIFAINKSTGQEIWKTPIWGSWVESSPVLHNRLVYIGSSDYRKVHALNPDDGIAIWGARLEGWAWSTPAISRKYVYAGSVGTLYYTDDMHGRFYAFDKKTGTPVWQVKVSDNKDVFAVGFASSPVIDDDYVFFGGLDGNLYGIKE